MEIKLPTVALIKPLAAVVALANAQLAGAVILPCPSEIVVDAIEAQDTDATTSLVEAIQTARSCSGNDAITIRVAEALAGQTESLSGTPHYFDGGRQVSINGPQTGDFTVTVVAPDQAALEIQESAQVSIADINFSGTGRSKELLSVQGATLNLTRVDINNVVSSSHHAAVRVATATATITDSDISGNESSYGAIGISGNSTADSASLTIRNSTLANNRAKFYRGGAVHAFEANITIEDSVFDGNSARADSASSAGGAISMAGEFGHAKATISGSTFRNNEARNYGGAIYQSSTNSLTIDDTVFEGNSVVAASNEYGTGASAEAHGGAMALDRSTAITVSQTTFRDNDATSRGGAIYIGRSGRNGSVTIEDSLFRGNTTTVSTSEATLAQGAAIATDAVVSDPYNLTIRRSTFTENQSSGPAGVLYANGQGVSADIESSTFDGNQAATESGVISAHFVSALAVRHVTATNNQVSSANNSDSGFMYLMDPDATVEVSHSVIHGNNTGAVAGAPICVASNEYGYSASLSYSFWDGDTNDACVALNTDQTMISSSDSPLLGALADNGGHTPTRMPEIGSPLIDTGDANISNAPDTDQRGSSRIARGAIDIGAVEYGNAVPSVSDYEDSYRFQVGDTISLNIRDWLSDADGDSLTYVMSGAPAEFKLSEAGVLTATATTTGEFDIEVTVSDGQGGQVTLDLNVLITSASSGNSGGPVLWLLGLLGGLSFRRRY